MDRRWLISGGLLGATGVLLSAYGSHGLARHVAGADAVELWKTAARYQVWHAAPVLFCALLPRRHSGRVGGAMTAGAALFALGVYGSVLSEDTRVFGRVAATGGVLLAAAWALLAYVGVAGQ